MYFSQNLSISCSIQVPYFDKLNFLHNSVYKMNGFYNRKHVNKEIALIIIALKGDCLSKYCALLPTAQ